jgi:hypothetical protein
MRNTALYVIISALAIPAVYGIFTAAMHLLVFIGLFFGSVETAQAPFTIVTLLLSAIAAGSAASVWHHLFGNDAWYVRTWSDWKEYHRVDILYYGVAGLGGVCGAMSFTLMLKHSPVPQEMGFGVFVCLVGLIGGGLSVFRVGAELVASTYHLFQNRPQGGAKQSRKVY